MLIRAHTGRCTATQPATSTALGRPCCPLITPQIILRIILITRIIQDKVIHQADHYHRR